MFFFNEYFEDDENLTLYTISTTILIFLIHTHILVYFKSYVIDLCYLFV